MCKELPRDNDGKLSAYAWPGGYPIFYLDNENNVLCPKCANKDGYSTELVAAWGDLLEQWKRKHGEVGE